MKKAKPTFKTFRVECKATEEDGVIDAFIPMSVNSVDRDEERILPSAFEKTLPIFLKRPVLLSSHSYSTLTSQIGEFVDIKVKGKGLYAKPKYYVNEGNPEADWAYKLAQHNMAAFSVGFIPKKAEEGRSDKDPRRTYTEVELLEISQVAVPSNRDAIQGLKAKAVGVEADLLDEVLESDLIEKVTKPEETQDYIRIPVSDGHGDHKVRYITVSAKEKIKGLYCVDDKEIITYLFDREEWDKESAQAWVDDHTKAFGELVSLVHEFQDHLDAQQQSETSPIVTMGYVQCEPMTGSVTSLSSDTVTTVDPTWATSTIYLAPGMEAAKATEKAVTEGDIVDDLDEIVTWFEQGGTLTKDSYTYAWRVIDALVKNAGPSPDDICKQPVDIVAAAKTAVMEILGGK